MMMLLPTDQHAPHQHPQTMMAALPQPMPAMGWVLMDPTATMNMLPPHHQLVWAMPPPPPAAAFAPAPMAPMPLPPFGGTNLNANAAPYRQPLQFSQSVQKKPSRPLVIPEPAPGDFDGPRQLIVNYLAAQVDGEDLRQLFASYGDIELTRIMKDPVTGESRGYGFVYFKRHEDALNAIEATTGRVLLGKRVRVSYAIPQRAHRSDSDTESDGAKQLH